MNQAIPIDVPSTKRPATYQDVIDAPSGMTAQLLHGELFLHPRPAVPHLRTQGTLFGRLSGPFDLDGDPGGWWLFLEPELKLGDEEAAVVPDIAGWRRDRMPEPPRKPRFTLAPDWVCEVLSPSTTALDRGRKADHYAAHGVGHLWFADPEARILEAYGLDRGSWLRLLVATGDDRVRIPPFEAVELDLKPLWLPGPPPGG